MEAPTRKLDKKIRVLLAAIVTTSIAVMLLVSPIPQDISYHNFADQQSIVGIPHFLNVLSNLGFCVVGLLGVWQLYSGRLTAILPGTRGIYVFFFVSIFLVGLGSGYYHISPNNDTLIWDRLPMTLGFMSLIALIICEHVDVASGRKVLPYLLVIGAGSVGYWALTEHLQKGDLRPYALVQFIPILFIPIILLTLPSKFANTKGFWWLAFFYVLSKMFEHFDEEIFLLLNVISGHSLKHLSAAIGIGCLLYALNRRQPL